MKLWKKITILVLIIVLGIVLPVVLSCFVPEKVETVCAGIEIVIDDAGVYNFVSEKNVENYLTSSGLNPVGKKYGDISLIEMERKLSGMSMVKNVVCFFENNGTLCIKVTQRKPVFRVKDVNNDYYMDTDRQRMPTSIRYSAYVPVVTGNVDFSFAENDLYDFIVYLQNKSRWNAAFSQIYVYPDNRVELIPRVGDFVITMGTLDSYESKLKKLDLFLEKMPEYIGWNKYSEINLEYRNQVVCTKCK